MAKKDFKKGLGSLIQDTRKNTENQSPTPAQENSSDELLSPEELQDLLIQQARELHLWRTGKLTVERFEQTLHENLLDYDAQNNEIRDKG
jgi:hypothetical protein